MGQSSNDVFPSAVHLAALDEIVDDLLPALDAARARRSRRRRTSSTTSSSRAARTGWTRCRSRSGQEFGGYAAQVREGDARVEATLDAARADPARRHRGRHRPEHPSGVRRARARRCSPRRPGLAISAPADPFEAQAARDGLVEASGALKVVAVSLTKIANDLRFLGSGPRAGLAEIFAAGAPEGLARSCRARSTRSSPRSSRRSPRR